MFVQDKASDAFELMREARNHFVDAIELQAPAPPSTPYISFVFFFLCVPVSSAYSCVLKLATKLSDFRYSNI